MATGLDNGANAAGTDGTVNDGSGQSQPAGGGTGTEGGGSNAGTEGFDRSKLNPVLRSMNEQELNDVFDTLLQSVRQAPQAQVEPPKPQVQPEPDYKELLDPNSEKYNPKEAFQNFVQHNYSGLLGDINQRSLDAVFINMAQQLPDFRDYEQDIRTVLKSRDPLSLTQQDVLGTYYAVKGVRQTQEMLKKRREAAATGTAAPKVSPPKDEDVEPDLPANQVRIAQKMFPRAADPVAEYKKFMKRDTEGFEMKVPVGGGKYA